MNEEVINQFLSEVAHDGTSYQLHLDLSDGELIYSHEPSNDICITGNNLRHIITVCDYNGALDKSYIKELILDKLKNY